MELNSTNKKPGLLYSCYAATSRIGEQFIPEHVFSHVISGSLTIFDGNETHVFKGGDFSFGKRNHLAKFSKQPPAEGGEFQSISIYLDQHILREISKEHGYITSKAIHKTPVILLKPETLYQKYVDSLIPYVNLSGSIDEELLSVKIKEAILLMIKLNPELKDILFDFNEPGKIDLEAYMNKNFYFNVEAKRFAFLTGRSLATFKRDFKKIFNTSPHRWLQQRRLKEAYYLIKEKGKKASEVYLEVGFEDLSHFSFAFKNAFGISPSRI